MTDINRRGFLIGSAALVAVLTAARQVAPAAPGAAPEAETCFSVISVEEIAPGGGPVQTCEVRLMQLCQVKGAPRAAPVLKHHLEPYDDITIAPRFRWLYGQQHGVMTAAYEGTEVRLRMPLARAALLRLADTVQLVPDEHRPLGYSFQPIWS